MAGQTGQSLQGGAYGTQGQIAGANLMNQAYQNQLKGQSNAATGMLTNPATGALLGQAGNWLGGNIGNIGNTIGNWLGGNTTGYANNPGIDASWFGGLDLYDTGSAADPGYLPELADMIWG